MIQPTLSVFFCFRSFYYMTGHVWYLFILTLTMGGLMAMMAILQTHHIRCWLKVWFILCDHPGKNILSLFYAGFQVDTVTNHLESSLSNPFKMRINLKNSSLLSQSREFQSTAFDTKEPMAEAPDVPASEINKGQRHTCTLFCRVHMCPRHLI